MDEKTGVGKLMMDDGIALAALVSVLMVLLSFLIHYEALYWISRYIPRVKLVHGRLRMMLVVTGVFAAHTLEVWAYAICFYLLSLFGAGGLEGAVVSTDFLEYLYFSAVTYSSLGLGEIFPTGAFRLLTGVEALNGLVLIGWSASFTYLYMEKFWNFPKK